MKLVLLALLVAGGLFLWQNLQNILDWWAFTQYKPPTAIASVASGSGMTDDGKFAFYAAQPTIDGTSDFNTNCDRKEQNTAILGCYFANRIYIFDVKDVRLNGIKEVTGTHEMLHAIYQRLSQGERDRINKLLLAEYDKLKKNQKFYDRMDFYTRTEPGEFNNELHSIIGTEVRNVSDELEQHYAKYFSRSKILELFEGYEGEFTKLENQAANMKKQLEALHNEIESDSETYRDDVAELDGDIAEFNSRAKSGDFSTQAEFDSEREQLLNRVAGIKSQRAAINDKIDEYNDIRDAYNKLVTQQNDLQKSIDSTLAPAPSI